MKIIDLHTFDGGMDLDSDPRYVAPNCTREQRNVRYDSVLDSKSGDSVNIKGTSLVPKTLTIVGVNTALNSCYDEKRNSIIVFYHNNLGYHSIVNQNLTTGATTILLVDGAGYWRNGSRLAFTLTGRVSDPMVIGDVLYWLDSNKRPRKLNIIKRSAYSYIDDAVIDALNHPPMAEPVCSVKTVASVKTNMIRGASFQFRYRYVYDDESRSVASPISKPVYPREGYTYNGMEMQSLSNNAIDVAVETGGCSVKAIEIMSRQGNTGDWFLAKSLDKIKEGIADGGIYSWRFFNNSVCSALDQTDVNRLYDYLPDEANTQEFIDNKYLAYAGTVDGFDNIDVDVQLSVLHEILPKAPSGGSSLELTSQRYDIQFIYGEHGYQVTYRIIFLDWGILSALTMNNLIEVEVDLYLDEAFYDSRTRQYGADPNSNTSSVLAFREALMGYLNTDFSDLCSALIDYDFIPNQPGFPCDDSELGVVPIFSYEPYRKFEVEVFVRFPAASNQPAIDRIYGGAKTGAYHRFGIVYSNETKQSTVQTKDCLEVYVPAVPEVTLANTGARSNDFRSKIRWELFHDPPSWATRYRFVYAGRRNVGAFKQYIVGGEEGHPAVYNISGDAMSTYVNLTLLNELTFKRTIDPDAGTINNDDIVVDFPIPNSRLEPYVFAKGDRIRFYTKSYFSSTFVLSSYPLGARLTDYIDLEILGYAQDVDGADTNTIRVQRFSPDTDSLERGSLVEIYSPNKGFSDDIYYEFGETYSIATVNGVKKHVGQNGSTTTPSGIFDSLDVVHILRAMPIKFASTDVPGQRMFWVESDEFSDFFESPVSVNGRINAYDVSAARRYSGIVRRSLGYFEDTKTNGLGSFRYDDYLNIGSTHGEITKIVQVGYTMKVIQPRKITSVYIGKNGLRQASSEGIQVVVASDNVFNTTNPSESPYGCIDRDSIIVVDRQLFFFDRYNKCICRDAPNGILDISREFKIASETSKLAAAIISANGRVVFGFNRQHEELICTFDIPQAPETMLLSVNRNNFKCFLDFTKNNIPPDYYVLAGDDTYAFLAGQIWKLNSSTDRGLFFGEQKTASISIVVNKNPITVKTYDAITLNASDIWDSPGYGDITIPISNNQPQGMSSKLTRSQYSSEEGVFHAAFLKNAKTTSVTPNIYDLINGDTLRGQYLLITLYNASKNEVHLHSVVISCTDSPVTK